MAFTPIGCGTVVLTGLIVSKGSSLIGLLSDLPVKLTLELVSVKTVGGSVDRWITTLATVALGTSSYAM
jgi:hypothetical protein